MPTANAGSPSIRPVRRSRIPKVIGWTLEIVILVVLAAAVCFYFMAHAALPQLDGSVILPGLSSPVTVMRDAHGVPTIEAGTLDDLFFAQGYVTAQDRLFQIDGMRRFAAGELSEILGPDLLKHDREQRIYGLSAAAEKAAEVQSEEDRHYFEAYARGVNVFIDSHRNNLPLEFRILGYSPRPWKPVDSMLIAAQMVEDLSSNPRNALTREKILAKLGPELTADLYVNTSVHDHPPTEGSAPKTQGSRDLAISKTERRPTNNSVLRPLTNSNVNTDSTPPDPSRVIGSNNWVLSGGHTISGKPLLSNDMHLGHQMPNLWYEAHLRCGNYDVAGVTLPGIPYVIVGHNQRIAWGFTNVGPTVEDAYIETFSERGQYLTPDGWKEPEHWLETIHIKGKSDVTLDIPVTRHGPIISELIPGETRKVALKWTLYDGIHNPFFKVNSAANWNEFRRAFSDFDAPGQNVVYADVDGNIGYQATGKIPIRAAGDGRLPEDGTNNDHEWIGYIPFDKMPSIFNPPSGVIATANGRITPDGYPYSISSEWEAPWRTEHIYSILSSNKQFFPPDLLTLQTDIYSEFDHLLAEKLGAAIEHARSPSQRAKQAADLMREWDGRLTMDAVAPTIELGAQNALIRLLLEPKLGPAPRDQNQAQITLNWKSYRWMSESVWLENVIQHQPERWLPAAYVNYDELLAAAVEAAIAAPGTPKDLRSWRWGKFHPVQIQHPIFGRIPLLRRWSGPGVQEQSGNGYTVKAVSRSHGPSERMTVDLGNLDHSTLNLVTGEAGDILSPYYMDQWKAWYEGSTFQFPFSKSALEQNAHHTLVLEPAK